MPLIVVPTPIGNLGDITLRALEVLKDADLIACEDTRKTSRLLQHFEIRNRLVSYYEHNEKARTSYLLRILKEDRKVALVSDAGTPGISDPGYVIIKAALDEGIQVDVLPGASAIIPAVLFSGFQPHPFTFVGFLPDKKGERIRYLEKFKDISWPVIFFLSPHKAVKHLEDMTQVFGERRCALSREISKIYQETLKMSLSELIFYISDRGGIKGELVLVVDEAPINVNSDEKEWNAEVLDLLGSGMSVKNIVLQIQKRYDLPKNRIKKFILENTD